MRQTSEMLGSWLGSGGPGGATRRGRQNMPLGQEQQLHMSDDRILGQNTKGSIYIVYLK